MGEKIVIGPLIRGLRQDFTAFNIDNESFPTLTNAYQWRGRVKRKRGTETIGQLNRYFDSTSTSYIPVPITITLDGSGNGNLITGVYGISVKSPNASIVPGSVTLTVTAAGPVVTVYTDPTEDGYLTPTGTGGPNTINYASGSISISAQAGSTVSAQFVYSPNLPGMGIEDFISSTSAYPLTNLFDTVYAYNISTSFPYPIHDIGFYKNPPSSGSYVQKPAQLPTPTSWNGQDYQQFYTVNYKGALWTTNGVTVPFDFTNVGMQFAPKSTITVTATTATTISVTITNCPLIIGDFVFLNEFVGSGTPDTTSQTLNFQSGYVTSCTPNTPPLATKTIVITLPNAAIASDTYTPGIIQYLTNRSDPALDCLRWYDGDPSDGINPPTFIPGKGWVNFMPPLSQFNYSISDEPLAVYYLVGARIIIPFQDRLLFMGPVIQTSSGSPIYLQDTIIYSEIGSPYYTASFNGGTVLNPVSISPILVPVNETGFPPAYFEDQAGFGGSVVAGVDQPIVTAALNQDVIIIGFSNLQSRLIFTGNDIAPFAFFVINTEYGSSSTFSTIVLDKGILTRGYKGFILTSQVDCQRFDLEIPDQVFEVFAENNGIERVCAQRDFINEWVYFTYPSSSQGYNFPNQTMFYNYRDNSWSLFNECYTTYGNFRRASGFTWATVPYSSWDAWDEPWNAGQSEPLQPIVLGLNQQGYVIIKGIGTSEGTSLSINSFSGSIVTSVNHCLNTGDFIIIDSCLGTIGQFVNGRTFQITEIDDNTFLLSPNISSGTYFGAGTITRIYVPQIQTKQFPVAWELARKTRIGTQMYLLSTTTNSQITLFIYLSQNAANPYNEWPTYPELVTSENNGLIYSTVLFTCPESSNLGLSPYQSNLQMPAASGQSQIWHRISTSLIGDTVQFGFTLSPTQITSLTPYGDVFLITGATNAYPCVLTCLNAVSVGNLVLIQNVLGMTQLNGGVYQVTARDNSTVTINVDSTTFGTYISGGTLQATSNVNAFEEIELHSIILDVSPSSLLA
jgi:hypothetical protein